MLRVDAPATPGDPTPVMFSKASEQLRARVYKALGLKVHNIAWVTVVPGSAKGDAAIRALIAERNSGDAIVGFATLTETFDRTDSAQARWFYLNTRVVDDFSLWDDYPSCKAGSLPKVHALNHSFVSSAFVDVCRRRQLTGIEFLRCASRGRKRGDPWFAALPEHSLGRGCDHPWFDREKWLRDVSGRRDRRSSGVDVGQSVFHQRWMREAAAGEPPLDLLLQLCPTPAAYTSGIEGLQIVTIPRYWTGALPSTDFAYVPEGEDGPNVEGKMMRFRTIAVSARAREVLLEEGLFTEKVFLPVRVVDSPGEAALDRPDDPVPPMYSPDELAILRERERVLLARE